MNYSINEKSIQDSKLIQLIPYADKKSKFLKREQV